MGSRRTYRLEGVDCAVCAARIQTEVETIPGVGKSEIDLLTNHMEITFDTQPSDHLDASVRETVRKAESGIRIEAISDAPRGHNRTSGNRETPYARFTHHLSIPVRVVSAAAAAAIALNVPNPLASLIWFLAAFLISGYDVVARAAGNIAKGMMLDEQFLMTIATIGAFVIGEYAEAVAVMAFYQIGEYFQSMAVRRSRASIAKLMDIKPVVATVIRNGEPVAVEPEAIAVGEIILIKPGERIPVDAVVLSGSSSVDTKALTGESAPRHIESGDQVISGCVNGEGLISARATVRYADSTVAGILRLVEESGMRKARTERFITRFARYYTPVVVVTAVLVASIPPLVIPGAEFSDWLYRALVFLVVSCPCALVISVPMGFFAGIGGMARMGVLAKGGNYVQALAKTKTVVFDKTGTLTQGVFEVTSVKLAADTPFDRSTILAYASAVEQNSNHPVAKAVAGAFSTVKPAASDVREIPGLGIRGTVEGHAVAVGTRAFMKSLHADIVSMPGSDRWVLVMIDGMIAASLAVTDKVKPEAAATVANLRKLGVERIVMLSGDSSEAASEVGSAVGITEIHAALLPRDKVRHLEQLLAEQPQKGSLVFVGDGINDAPVLARADVGVSMGVLGSDAAVEASDVVIMTDDLSRIPNAITHARRTVGIVTQNIVFALGVKGVVMVLGAAGIASMWLAVLADTGVALLAVLNALRALKAKRVVNGH